MIKTRVSEMLGIEYPLIQAGMSLITIRGADLAAAVSNAGGLGIIHESPLEILRQEVRKAKALTDKPFGVNIPIAAARGKVEETLEVLVEEGVRVVTTSAGNPELWTRRFQEAGIRVLHVVPSVKHALKAEECGVDAVIAEGYEAGGHNGVDEITTMLLVPQVVDAVRIPVVAAGGIGDARGMLAAFALGAEGVQMGTRFIATQECAAHPHYKEALVRASDTDTVVLERSLGRVNRTLKTELALRALSREKGGAPPEEIRGMINTESYARAALEGDMADGWVYSGQVAGMIHEVLSAGELIQGMIRDFYALRERLCQL